VTGGLRPSGDDAGDSTVGEGELAAAAREEHASAGPASGIPARGYTWPPFEKGNEVALRHGMKSVVKVAPRAAEIAEQLRGIVPGYREPDDVSIALLSSVLARLEGAYAWLDEHGILDGNGTPHPVLKIISTSENTAARLCAQLGLTPASRAAMGLDVALARRAVTLTDLVVEAEDQRERGGG
jgi:hypothetical protein